MPREGAMQKRAISFVLMAGILVFSSISFAQSSSENYTMKGYVIGSAGGVSSSADYTMLCTAGEPAVGTSASEDYELEAGFLGSVGSTTPVVLESFDVVWSGDAVVITWTTFSEIANAGFNIYRSSINARRYTRLNTGLISGNGTYEFVDPSASAATQYYYKIGAVDLYGNEVLFGPLAILTPEALPTSYEMFQNVPNPFNPTTEIAYDVPKPGGHITISIYNSNGQLVKTLVDRNEQPGHHSVAWHGKDQYGRDVSSGVYFYRMKSNVLTETKRLVLLR
jgi:hypothetical protein